MPVIAKCGSEKVGQFFLLSSTVIFLINNAQHPKFKIKSMVFFIDVYYHGHKVTADPCHFGSNLPM